MAEEQQKKFDISKYVTAQDIVAAITAGVVAYIRNSASVDDQQQPAAGGTPQQDADFDPTIRVDHGRLDITDPNNWKDGGVVNMNGNEIHVFKAPDGSTIRVNPYQLQAAGGDPMKAAMNQFAAKVQNGEVDLDKMFSAGTTVTTQSGMPVTVNAPPGTNAQDAIAQVRQGLSGDQLAAAAPAPSGNSAVDLAKNWFSNSAKFGAGAKMVCPNDVQLASIAKNLGLQDSTSLQDLIDGGQADAAFEKLLSYGPVGTSDWTGTSGNQLMQVLGNEGKQDVVKAFYQGLLDGKSPDEVARGALKALADSHDVMNKTTWQSSWSDAMIKKCLKNAGMM